MHLLVEFGWRFAAIYGSQVIMVAMFFIVGLVLEAIATVDRHVPASERFLNCIYAAFFLMIDVAGVSLMARFVFANIAAPFHGLIWFAVSDRNSLLLAIPLSLSMLALQDFFYYWMHRLQHKSKWLWAMHELHHSDEHMNVTTGPRHHWLESPLQLLFIAVPIFLLLKPPIITVVSAVVFSKWWGYFIHLNARISFGALNRIFVTPHTHHIHHSRSAQHFDKNFASFFSLWDVIFGTYHHPASEEWPQSGLEGVKVSSLWQAVSMPFASWRRMLN